MTLTLKNSQVKQFYDVHMAYQVKIVDQALSNGKTTQAQVQLVAFDKAFANLRAAFPNATQDIRRIEELQSNLIAKATLLDRVQSSSIHHNEMIDARPTGIRRPGSHMNCGFNSVFQCMMNTVSLTKTISQEGSSAAKTLSPLAKTYTQAQATSKSVAEGLDAQKIRMVAAPQLSADHDRRMAPTDPRRQEDAFDIWQSLAKQLGVRPVLEQTYTDFSKTDEKPSVTNITEPGIRLALTGKAQKFEDLMAGYFDEVTDRGVVHRGFTEAPDTLVVQADRTAWSARRGQHNLDTPILGVPETYTVPQESTPSGKGKLDYQIKGCVIQKGSLKGGHFISLQKKSDGWYVVDDDVVRKVSNREAQGLLKKGYLFFYERKGVEAARPPSKPVETAASYTPPVVKSTGSSVPSIPVGPIQVPVWAPVMAYMVLQCGAMLMQQASQLSTQGLAITD